MSPGMIVRPARVDELGVPRAKASAARGPAAVMRSPSNDHGGVGDQG